jgi:hypothetical protein
MLYVHEWWIDNDFNKNAVAYFNVPSLSYLGETKKENIKYLCEDNL